ncbi:TPA: hypothetical protein DCX15_05565, partial [bacterium]|nr:hypothetical protein [bacterium]
TLKVWKRELREESWTMARRNAQRSSADPEYGDWYRIIEVWNYRFHSPLSQEVLPGIPSPIIAKDMVIVPDPSNRSFLGVKVGDGEVLTSSNILSTRLSYASTPVYINPFLLFASNGAIYQFFFREKDISLKSVLSDPKILPIDYTAPVSAYGKAFFILRECALLYQPDTGEHWFIPIRLTQSEDFLRSPVLWKEELILLSRYGEILALPFKNKNQYSLKRISKPLSGTICSSPCLVGETLYFEFLNEEGLRGIYAYNLRSKNLERIGVEEGVCSPDDNHLNFSPAAFQDGVLISSDITPRLFYVSGGPPIRVTPIDLEIQTGRLQVHQTSHIFFCILGNRLVGRTPGGFFHLDLLNPKEGAIEVFRPRSEIVGQPLNYGQRLFFITQEGVRCYAILK